MWHGLRKIDISSSSCESAEIFYLLPTDRDAFVHLRIIDSLSDQALGKKKIPFKTNPILFLLKHFEKIGKYSNISNTDWILEVNKPSKLELPEKICAFECQLCQEVISFPHQTISTTQLHYWWNVWWTSFQLLHQTQQTLVYQLCFVNKHQ